MGGAKEWDTLTEAERKQLLQLSTSWVQITKIMGMSRDTLETIAAPYGRAKAETIAKARARLAELREAKK